MLEAIRRIPATMHDLRLGLLEAEAYQATGEAELARDRYRRLVPSRRPDPRVGGVATRVPALHARRDRPGQVGPRPRFADRRRAGRGGRAPRVEVGDALGGWRARRGGETGRGGAATRDQRGRRAIAGHGVHREGDGRRRRRRPGRQLRVLPEGARAGRTGTRPDADRAHPLQLRVAPPRGRRLPPGDGGARTGDPDGRPRRLRHVPRPVPHESRRGAHRVGPARRGGRRPRCGPLDLQAHRARHRHLPADPARSGLRGTRRDGAGARRLRGGDPPRRPARRRAGTRAGALRTRPRTRRRGSAARPRARPPGHRHRRRDRATACTARARMGHTGQRRQAGSRRARRPGARAGQRTARPSVAGRGARARRCGRTRSRGPDPAAPRSPFGVGRARRADRSRQGRSLDRREHDGLGGHRPRRVSSRHAGAHRRQAVIGQGPLRSPRRCAAATTPN